jgi:mannose-1-phosphate guanylyltransferase
VLHDVRDSYIRSEHRMVGAVGLTNVVIVDTPDALLVADASRAQDVKQLYAR